MVLHSVVHMKHDRNSPKTEKEKKKSTQRGRDLEAQKESWREEFKPWLLSRLCAAGKSQHEAGVNVRLSVFFQNVAESVGHGLNDVVSGKKLGKTRLPELFDRLTIGSDT